MYVYAITLTLTLSHPHFRTHTLSYTHYSPHPTLHPFPHTLTFTHSHTYSCTLLPPTLSSLLHSPHTHPHILSLPRTHHPSIFFPLSSIGESITLIKDYADELLPYLNKSLGHVLEEWAEAKTVEVRLLERVAIEREEVRVKLTAEANVLKGEVAVLTKNLAKTYTAMSKTAAIMAQQVDKINLLSPLPEKVSTVYVTI